MRRNYSNFKQGDIVTIELPFSDYSSSKLRPVLIISCDSFNISSNDVIVAKITGSKVGSRFAIRITNANLSFGRLKKTSYIDISFLFTVEKELIKKKIARINNSTLQKVKTKLEQLFIE
ncbi:MAG: type II toxin-antitoxin system PemK/MazF family toxin [Candidatus Diapherotrites archaeon]|nr:type II toxin-antitoxin system PemK/MazF family toxin [Candidatus Diapherotrites archaeon]